MFAELPPFSLPESLCFNRPWLDVGCLLPKGTVADDWQVTSISSNKMQLLKQDAEGASPTLLLSSSPLGWGKKLGIFAKASGPPCCKWEGAVGRGTEAEVGWEKSLRCIVFCSWGPLLLL